MIEAAPSKPVCAQVSTVVHNSPLCRAHWALEFVLPEFPASHPGQFLQLLCDNTRAAGPAQDRSAQRCHAGQASGAFLRRPFSIADHWSDEQGRAYLCIVLRAVGKGSRWLAQLAPGDPLNLTGPLGRGFHVPEPEAPCVLVGGGVGIPPLLYLARRLHETGHRDVTLIFGSTTRELLPLRLRGAPTSDGTPRPCLELPGDAHYGTIITTDDGSLGLRGVVTDALGAWHRRRTEGARAPLVFACGPEAMLRAVARQTRELGLSCQLCIERRMGCGLGTCLSCVVRVRDDSHAAGWRWALACNDGPVFERDHLVDELADRAP
ncbi:MAG: dihydroorotate dehydrogenase electron transfer subunit [Planctomycetes bacterium]|nr:dihydroorotate dehydrogenase electron transfer subunit [Planctomycetota bacterium]